MSKQTYRVCFCFRRKFKMAITEALEKIKTRFEQYSENGSMTADHLQRFLIEVQKEVNVTKEGAQVIIEKSLHEFNSPPPEVLNLEAFFKYLFNDFNPPVSCRGASRYDCSVITRT